MKLISLRHRTSLIPRRRSDIFFIHSRVTENLKEAIVWRTRGQQPGLEVANSDELQALNLWLHRKGKKEGALFQHVCACIADAYFDAFKFGVQ